MGGRGGEFHQGFIPRQVPCCGFPGQPGGIAKDAHLSCTRESRLTRNHSDHTWSAAPRFLFSYMREPSGKSAAKAQQKGGSNKKPFGGLSAGLSPSSVFSQTREGREQRRDQDRTAQQ